MTISEKKPVNRNRLLSIDFWVRILGMVVLGYVGWYFSSRSASNPATEDEILAMQLLTLSGAGLGLLITHRMILYPIRNVNQRLRKSSAQELIALGLGTLLGVVIGALLAVPLSNLPGLLGNYLPAIASFLAIYFSIMGFEYQKKNLANFSVSLQTAKARPVKEAVPMRRTCLVDTSAIIDGRVLAVVRSGFLDGILVVPRFVLNELQLLADSSDDMKRMRGRRGLDMLEEIRKDDQLRLEMPNEDIANARGVDQKLVTLALQDGHALITNDKNLSQVAELQGVQVLNLNVLSDAVRPPVGAGEMLVVKVREEGREREQGIGYLEDGTMVVVEDARERIGDEVRVIVSRVWTNDRGRMVFGRIMGSAGAFYGGKNDAGNYPARS
ncbi:PIN/TRAM domain-containing protein [Herpetosiphon geysericola]|uniref:PIN/TRAM domain-containing protein n=1 Tax=Herpetosiphon geysericola TaxID=70996 RepID=UPI0009F8BA94|nr:TRAM domain-containing protein [Herpetosiphon geysericola]